MFRCSLGIDIGGTFTDLVILEHDTGRLFSCKVLTTHRNPADAVVEGAQRLLIDSKIDAAAISRVVHATTLFTNALIERKGAVTGLVTTKGFRDILEIGRERKFELYDISARNLEPLVPRNLRCEVNERLLASGEVSIPLDENSVKCAARSLTQQGVTSIAVSFLHAYANPVHEQQAVRAIKQAAPDVFVTASHEVAPEVREYERTSTAVVNAYVKPLAGRYIDEISHRLHSLGIMAPLLLMLSNGGLTHAAEAKRVPVQMLESGPAAGSLAAGHFGLADGENRILAFDMGGTTAKLSVVEDGEPLISYFFEAARQKRFIEGSGLPVRISTVELIEIGAGGGSVAHRDDIGLLKVGPESSGSEPGPVCYGRGGVEPTVTDANFHLGLIHPATFAGGSLRIDSPAASRALERLANDLELQVDELARGIYAVVNENMAAAARVHIAEKGRDPSIYTLICTGGGGPVHAYQVARKLGIKRLICPPDAGVASALGLIIAPARADRVSTVNFKLSTGKLEVLERQFAALENEARQVIEQTLLGATTVVVQRFADGRFSGQGFELVVPLPPGPFNSEQVRELLKESFEKEYTRKFMRAPPNVSIEFINIRVSVRAPSESALSRAAASASYVKPASTRKVYFPELGDFAETTVHDRGSIRVGEVFQGPAVIEEIGATLVVGPGCCFEVMPSRNVVVTMP